MIYNGQVTKGTYVWTRYRCRCHSIEVQPNDPKETATMAYPVTRSVRVTFEDGDTMIDGMAGLNPGHALWRARQCWDGAEIQDLGPFDAVAFPYSPVTN
jgi:hypothetical protein